MARDDGGGYGSSSGSSGGKRRLNPRQGSYLRRYTSNRGQNDPYLPHNMNRAGRQMANSRQYNAGQRTGKPQPGGNFNIQGAAKRRLSRSGRTR